MKKLLAILLVALMAVSVAACAPSPSDLNNIVNDALNGLQSEIENNIDSDIDTDFGNDNDDNDDTDTDETVSVNFNSNLGEQVVYDKNNIKVTVTEITYEEYYGPTLSLLLENNSAKDITISSENVSVNNIVCNAYMYEDVNAGKKTYADMSFYESDLTSVGITEIGTIEFFLHIYEQETYDTIDDSDVIKLVVNENVTAAPVSNGEKIYSKNGITIYNEKPTMEDDDYYDYVSRFFIVNETNTDISISTDDVSVNGFMINPYCSETVPAGKMAYTSLYFSKTDLEDNKIKEIEEVELSFSIYNSESYDTIDDTDAIIIKAN